MAEIGVRAQDLGLSDARSLGKLARMLGFSRLQLAPSKALADCPRPPEPIGRAWADEVRRDLELSRVGIAALGCYVDICGPASALSAAAPDAAFIVEDQDAQGMAAGLTLLGNLP